MMMNKAMINVKMRISSSAKEFLILITNSETNSVKAAIIEPREMNLLSQTVITNTIKAIAMGIGFKKAKEKMMHLNIPLVLRKTLSDNKIEKKFNNEKENLEKKIKNELLSNSNYLEYIKKYISSAVKNSISSQIDKARMLIK